MNIYLTIGNLRKGTFHVVHQVVNIFAIGIDIVSPPRKYFSEVNDNRVIIRLGDTEVASIAYADLPVVTNPHFGSFSPIMKSFYEVYIMPEVAKFTTYYDQSGNRINNRQDADVDIEVTYPLRQTDIRVGTNEHQNSVQDAEQGSSLKQTIMGWVSALTNNHLDH